MFTDSKIFYMQPTKGGRSLRYWGCKSDATLTQPIVRSSKGVHMYAGVTYYGTTALRKVTKAGGQKSKHTDPRTNATHRGVCAKEYEEVLLDTLLPGAKALFAGTRWADKWTFQQDGAPVHRTRSVHALLTKMCPRWEQAWPAISPDLSWIENI